MSAAQVKITWGGYVSIELNAQQWGKIDKLKGKTNVETVLNGLLEVTQGSGFKLTFDRVDELQRISITNVSDAFGDGKQYVVQAGGADIVEALLAALEKFTVWTKIPVSELPIQGLRKGRF